MGVMRRLSGILQAKANKALDKAEDPRETLDFNYQKQLEALQQLRRGLADVATSRKRLEIQAEQLKQSASKLENQARQALEQNREDLAKEALSRRSAIADQLQDLQSQHEQLVAQENKIMDASQRAQAKVDAFRTRKETIKATYTAAQAQTQIGEAISGISEEMGDAGLAMQRAEDKVNQMQARASAIDELMTSGALEDSTGSTDDIQAQLNQGLTSSQVQNELDRLKAEIQGPKNEISNSNTNPTKEIENPKLSSKENSNDN